MTPHRTAPLLLALGLAAALPALAQQQPAATGEVAAATAPGSAVVAQSIKTSATVVAMDPATRSLTLKRQDGKVVTMQATDDVRNFDQIKVGDKVHAEYTQSLALDLKKNHKGEASATSTEGMTRSEPGQKPGGVATHQVVILADVTNVDHKKKLVTLRGPAGNTVDMEVDDPKQLAGIKKGDKVQAVYTESMAIKVEPAGKK